MEELLLENSKRAVKGPLCRDMKKLPPQFSAGDSPLVRQFG